MSKLIQWFVRYRVPITFIIFAALVIKNIATGMQPHSIHSFSDLIGMFGFFIALSGLFLRSWAAGVIHKTKQLATTGPYAICRNPLYLGSLLLTMGICIVLGSRLNLFATFLLIIFIYLPKIRNEEKHLKGIFGIEWERYADRTPALIPNNVFVNLKSSWSKIQWLHNKEYKAFLTGLVALLVLDVWHQFMR